MSHRIVVNTRLQMTVRQSEMSRCCSNFETLLSFSLGIFIVVARETILEKTIETTSLDVHIGKAVW